MKKVVVLGAGYAGVLTAKKLAKKAKKDNQEVDITLIDKNPFHTMLTELHEVAAGRVDESSIRIDLKKIFAGRDVNVVLDNIEKIDYGKKSLQGAVGTYDYDRLVMATGCKPTYFGVKGAKEYGFPLWSYDDSVRLRDHIMSMFRKASSETNPEKKKAMLNFYIIGGGFTGVEMAGELAELAPFACHKFGLNPEEVSVHLIDVLDRIMPVIPKEITDKAMRRFAKKGVDVKLKTNVVGLGEGSIEFKTPDGQTITDPTQTVVWAAGTEGSDIALAADELGIEPKTRGRIRTDSFLRSENDKNVYIAGDNMFYIPEGETRSVPQMVENCEHCAGTIAANIMSELAGREPEKVYKPAFHGAMVSIGGRYAITHGGLPGKFFGMPSFFAMAAKHFINIIYFIQVLGWNKIGSYIYNEFLTIRNGRSIVGGHFTNRTPSFLLFPMRIWMGSYFFYFAYKRIVYGWLDHNILGTYFESLRGLFRPSLFELDFWNQFRLNMYILDGYVAMWFQATPFSWFMEKFVLASDAQVMFWQYAIVITTMLVGLAFIGGLFTTLASIYALLFSVIFVLGVGLGFKDMWIPFAAIALLFTGSKALSLDYYFMPWLKKKWNRIGWVRKWYLYND